MAKGPLRSSFSYAVDGIIYAWRTQRNIRIHGVAAVIVLLLASLFALSPMRWLFLLLAITLVIAAELFNTAIEAVVDLVSIDHHPLAKVAKDTAAGAVFITAVFAVVVGIVVFYRPIIELL
ncbi:diacylglycerol kinase family protein [Paenibacillus sp. CMAA1364]